MSEKKSADFFPYTEQDLDALKKKDKKLSDVIERYGIIERKINSDVFSALVGSIISQQISGKAADTVEARLVALCGGITPERIYNTEISAIQQCGTSMRKAGYIKAAGKAVYTGAIDLSSLANLSDDDIIRLLSSLPGVGVWTVEMLLIFSLGRMDVLSYGDLAIRRGLCKLYGHETLTQGQFAEYKKRYSPYGSLASLYLWKLSVE